MAIEAAIVILENKLLNLIHSKEKSSLMPSKPIEEAVKKLKRIYAFLIKEESQQSDAHRNWKERLLSAINKIEDEIETFLYRVALQQQDRIKVVPDSWVILKNKYSFYQAMQQFMKATDGLSEDQHLVNSVADSAVDPLSTKNPQPQSVWFGISCGDIDMSELEGTTQEQGKLKLVKDLTDMDRQSVNEIKILAIRGPAGVGKTAITRAVFNSAGIRGRFQCHVWVQMSSNIDYKNLLLRIVNQVIYWVPMNPEHMDTHKLAELVSKQLVRKSILIVLEDAENLNVLFEFLIRLPDSPTGSCIIITTTSERIANVLANPINLEPLPEQYQRKLFTKTILKSSPPLDDNEISSMLKSCGGSPHKISLLGKLLSCSKREDWQSIANKQGSSSEMDVYGMSYNNLPPHIKPCFLYLCLFPKSFPILIRRILRLWISEDLIGIEHRKDHHNIQLEDIGESYLQEMVNRNLVEVVKWKSDGTPHALHMNANLYDTCLPLARTIGLLDVHKMDELKNQSFNYVRWLVEPEYAQGKWPDRSSYLSNIVSGRPRSFMSFHIRKGMLTNDLGRLFQILISKRNLGLLRVLDLEGVYKPYLGKSLQKLLLLRYLGLRSTGIDSLPKGVGNLPYLETLDVKHTNVIGLPTSIWKMTRIRHLDLNGFHFDEAQLRDFSRATFISSLRTLSGFHVACRIDEHILSIDLHRLTNLAKLGINFHNPLKGEMDEIAKWISTLTGLKSLKLGITGRSSKEKDGPGMLLPHLVSHNNLFRVYLLGKLQNLEANRFPSCLRVLTLSTSNLDNDPMQSLGATATLPYLRELRLLADSYKGTEMICPEDSFQNLIVLKLWKLASLEKMIFGKRSMPKLEQLEIRYCSKLNIFEVAENLKAQLKELIVFSDPGKSKVEEIMKEKQTKFQQLYVRENNRGSLDELTEDVPDTLHSQLMSANEDDYIVD